MNATSRLRVLLASPLPPPNGGAATWTRHVLRSVRGHVDFDVRHFELGNERKRRVGSSETLSLPGRMIGLLGEVRRIHRLIRSFRPHLVHLTTFGGPGSLRDLAVVRSAVSRGVCVLLDFHTSKLGPAEPSVAVRGLTARAVRSASGARALEPGSETWLRSIATGPVRRIPNMIDPEDVAPEPPRGASPLRLVFLGRVVPAKGVFELAEACSRVDAVHLELVGPVAPSLEDRIRTVASAREHGRWLRLVGELDHPAIGERVCAADAVTLTSRAEAFPYAVLEGMVRSRPALVTPVGAMPEIVAAGGTQPCGVVTTGHTVDSIERGVRQLQRAGEELQRMGQRARERVELHYSSHRVMPQLLGFWRELARAASS